MPGTNAKAPGIESGGMVAATGTDADLGFMCWTVRKVKDQEKRTISIGMSGIHDQFPTLHLNVRQLEVFVAIARGGSTRNAADWLSRSQSAVSGALAELESALGVPLFDRVGRGLLLNENGRTLLPRAASLVEQVVEVEQLFSGEHSTPLRLAASMTIGEHILPPVVSEWKAAHPGSPVRLLVANTTGVLQSVAAFEADIGFIEGPQSHPELVSRQWLTDEMVIVAAPKHPLSKRRATRTQLRKAAWALRETGSGTREAADRWLLEQLGQVHVDFEVGTPEAIKALVAAGDALGFLPRHAVAQSIRRGELAEVQTGVAPAARRLALVVHRERRLGRGAEAFVRHCFGAVKERSRPLSGAAAISD